MNEKKFDDIIKGKMDNLMAGDGEESWSAFESKWDAASENTDIDTQTFDRLIKNKVIGHNQAYHTNHWHQMKEHLKTIEDRKNTVLITKTLEFAAIFLIVFTFSHLSDLINFDKHHPKSQKDQYAQIQSNKSTEKSIQKTGIDFENKRQNSFDKKIKVQNVLKQDTPEKLIPHFFVSDNKTSSSIPFDKLDMDPRMAIIALQQEETESIRTSQTAGLDDVTSLEKDIEENRLLNSVASLLKRDAIKPESEMAMIFPMKISHSVPSTTFGIAAYASGDINLINTPFDKLYSLASYNKEALNNSYGVNFSAKKSYVELETGLGYAHREYQPKLVTEAYGQFADHYFEKSLKKISYDIANIPLNFKFHFINQSNWSAYLMAGAALNLILNAKYDINETLRQGKLPAGRFAPEQARLDEKPFITGILNGDNFKDNYFASIGFGFGIEKKILGNTSIYIQPSYQRQILSSDIGIGPNKDKIHTSSLQFGVKTIIN
jgi:hypothetical protein